MAEVGEAPLVGHRGDGGFAEGEALELFVHPAHPHFLQVEHRRGVTEAAEAVEDRAAADAGVLGEVDDGDRLVGVLLDVALDALHEGGGDRALLAGELLAVVVGLAGEQHRDRHLFDLGGDHRRVEARLVDREALVDPAQQAGPAHASRAVEQQRGLKLERTAQAVPEVLDAITLQRFAVDPHDQLLGVHLVLDLHRRVGVDHRTAPAGREHGLVADADHFATAQRHLHQVEGFEAGGLDPHLAAVGHPAEADTAHAAQVQLCVDGALAADRGQPAFAEGANAPLARFFDVLGVKGTCAGDRPVGNRRIVTCELHQCLLWWASVALLIFFGPSTSAAGSGRGGMSLCGKAGAAPLPDNRFKRSDGKIPILFI